MTPGSLRTAAAAADARRFVGRATELRVAADVLDDDTPSRVLFVHGPGGIGKSATLRAVSRMASDLGYVVATLDPRAMVDDPERELTAVLAARTGPTVVVIDEADLLGSQLDTVRELLLDALPDAWRLVLGGREGPDPSWRAQGLDAIVVDVALEPLPDAEAALLLAAGGVDEVRQPDIVAWAQGSPLALTVAAAVPGDADGRPGAEELESRLTRWLAGRPILDVPADVLEVAALAPVVDARLLAAALPARPTRQAMRQLGALPVVERVGDRLVLHAVLAASIRARLDATAPDRARLVSRRIVEQLATRARMGDIRALVELSQFVKDPQLRQAVSNQPSPSLFTSSPQPDDVAAFARTQGFDGGADWPEVERWAAGGQRYRLCVRRRDGSIVLYGAFDAVADLAAVGPVTSSLAEAAVAAEVDPVRSFVGIVLFADASDHERAEASRLGTGALMHQHGIADMQAVLIHFPAPDRRPREALAAIAEEARGPWPRPVALSDFRPGGAVGFLEQIVLSELGVEAPREGAAHLLVHDDDPAREAQLRALIDQVFGPSEEEQRLRAVIELAHLGPRRTEQECLDALHVSRRTWFRLLRKARERVLLASDPETTAEAEPPS